MQLQYGSFPHVSGLQHETPSQQQWSGRTSMLPSTAPVEVTQLPDWRGMATMYCSRDDTSMLDRPGKEGHPELLDQLGPSVELYSSTRPRR